MDHAPGPIIATVPLNVARTTETHGSPVRAIAIHNSITAINVPTTGVQKPTRSSVPAHAAIISGIIDAGGAIIPTRMSKMAVRMRCSRRPIPGQPLAKFEKSRCKVPPIQADRKESRNEIETARGWRRQSYFWGRSIMPRFRPIVTAWARSFAPNFDRMLVTWLFTVASPIER
jgi:hypothetical protein